MVLTPTAGAEPDGVVLGALRGRPLAVQTPSHEACPPTRAGTPRPDAWGHREATCPPDHPLKPGHRKSVPLHPHRRSLPGPHPLPGTDGDRTAK